MLSEPLHGEGELFSVADGYLAMLKQVSIGGKWLQPFLADIAKIVLVKFSQISWPCTHQSRSPCLSSKGWTWTCPWGSHASVCYVDKTSLDPCLCWNDTWSILSRCRLLTNTDELESGFLWTVYGHRCACRKTKKRRDIHSAPHFWTPPAFCIFHHLPWFWFAL